MYGTEPDSRDAIVHAVWKVINDKGMSAFSMRNVAAAAGVSVGRIQYWFPSKDELLRASLEAMLEAAAGQHTAATESADDRETLWHLIWLPVSRAEDSRGGVSVFYQFVAAGFNHPPLARLLAAAKDGTETEAIRLLGRVAPQLDHPRLAARSLIAIADGLTMRVLLGDLPAMEAERTLRAELDRLAK